MFNQFMALARQLYPTGRAFKLFFQSELEKLTIAFSNTAASFHADAVSILNSILPDNDDFTADDATDWENRLGMTVNPLASLPDRKAAIIRKLNHPGINPAKAHYLYLQTQFQLANFNVYVYENIPAQDPFTVSGVNQLEELQYGDPQYGDGDYGSYLTNKVANHIDESKDLLFDLGGTYRCTFFIGGPTLGSFATVPLVRKDEFRELILKTKQTQTIALLFVNYV